MVLRFFNISKLVFKYYFVIASPAKVRYYFTIVNFLGNTAVTIRS